MTKGELLRIGLDAVGDRVSDMFFGDHAGNVAATRHSPSPHYHRHDGVAAPHAPDHIEGGFVLPNHGEVAAGDIAQAHSGVGALQASPKACVDADHTVDVALIGDHDVAQAPGVLWLAQIVIETRFHRQDLDIGVHHFTCGTNEKHVGVARLWNGSAAAHQLQSVDGLARQHSACAHAHGYRNDHWHHDAVVESHLKDHCDGSHHRAGSAAHHCSHADHREGRDAEMN